MRKIAIIGLLVVMLTLTFAVPAQAEVLQNEKSPLSMSVIIPCSGEYVVLEGYLHIKWAVTSDGAGGYHVTSSFQPMGVQGVGDFGNKYNGVGGTRWTMNVKAGEVYTYVNVFRMVGAGKAPTFSVHQTIHYTVNANGVVTAQVDNYKEYCE